MEALCKGRGNTVEELAAGIGMKRSTLYNRLNKGNWQFTELAEAAEFLDEPISSFLDGLGGRFTATPVSQGADNPQDTGRDTSRCSASELVAA